MADASVQKVLRNFCATTRCPVWDLIQRDEAELRKKHPKARSEYRTWCPEECKAYQLTKFIETGNMRVVERTGRDRFE